MEMDFKRFKPKTKDEKENIHSILSLIREREVINWAQLEIKGSLLGIEIDEIIFRNLLKYIHIRSVYDFMLDSIVNSQECDKFFKCPEIIETILTKEGSQVFEQGSGMAMGKPIKFNCLTFLNPLEMRHPMYFLDFYLKVEPKYFFDSDKHGYSVFLDTLIRRWEVRVEVSNGQYKDFLAKLVEIRDKYSFSSMMLY